MTRLRGGAEPRPSHGLVLPTEPRRPPSPPNPFEFVHIIGSEMCAAEDIFLRGQLLPYKAPPTSPASTRSSTHPPPTACRGPEPRRCPSDHEGYPGRHRRAESLDGYERGGGAASRYWKSKGSLSVEYQRLRPVAEACEDRAGSRAGVASPRPKWYVLVFGSVRVPAEMDMRSIKSRLRRGSTSGGDGGRADSIGAVRCGVKAAAGGGGGGGGWKLLRSLSCKGDVGVVDAPFSFPLT